MCLLYDFFIANHLFNINYSLTISVNNVLDTKIYNFSMWCVTIYVLYRQNVMKVIKYYLKHVYINRNNKINKLNINMHTCYLLLQTLTS